MLSINIETQPIKMEFTSQRATLDTTTTSAQLSINTEAATLEIHQPNGELEIDQTPCRAAYGIKNMPDLIRDYGQAGRDGVIAAIGRAVEDGNRLAASIASGGNVIADMAAERAMDPPIELTIAYVPLPDIRYTPHSPQISVKDGTFDITTQPGSVQGNFKPGQVDINVMQYPSIKMWTSQNAVDMMV